MTKTRLLNVAAGVAMLLLTGCMPKITTEMLMDMRPARPPELDRLDMFVGDWITTTEMKIAGLDEPIKGTGTNTAKWDVDRWFLTEHGDYDMGPLGQMHVLGVWTWEPGTRKYRTWWFDDMGVNGSGTASVCSCCGKNWTIKASSKTPWGPTTARGTIKFINDDLLEWTWKEWSGFDILRLFPMANITGTSKRK